MAKEHFNPRMHLRNWVSHGTQIWRLHKESHDIKLVNHYNQCQKKGFYETKYLPTGTLDGELSECENNFPYKQILEHLDTYGEFPANLMNRTSLFVATQMVRTKKVRKEVAKHATGVVESAKNEWRAGSINWSAQLDTLQANDSCAKIQHDLIQRAKTWYKDLNQAWFGS